MQGLKPTRNPPNHCHSNGVACGGFRSVMFSDKDPITREVDVFFRALIPTAKDQPEIVIHDAGHFLQEDKGEEIARHIVDFIART